MFMHPAIIRRTGIFQCLRAVGHACGRRVLHDAQRNEQIHSDTDQLNGRILADRRYDIRKSEDLINKCCESSQERQQLGFILQSYFPVNFHPALPPLKCKRQILLPAGPCIPMIKHLGV